MFVLLSLLSTKFWNVYSMLPPVDCWNDIGKWWYLKRHHKAWKTLAPFYHVIRKTMENLVKFHNYILVALYHSHKKRKDSLETRAEPAVLRIYVENQAIQKPILLYRASKCKHPKEQGSEDCLWTHIFIFLCNYCQLFYFFLSRCKQKRIRLCYNSLQFVKEI